MKRVVDVRREGGASGVAEVRGWFASTGAAPAWRMVGTLVAGAALACVVGLVVHGGARPAGVAVTAVAGALVTAAGASVPARSGVRFALGAARVVSTVVGVALLIPLAALLPLWVLVGGAVLVMLLGTAYKAAFPMLAAAATTMGVIVMVGAPVGSITGYAALRLLDTLAGAGIALAFTYLLWPADKPGDDATTPSSPAQESTP